MGNFRSRSGCLTCRARRVKCEQRLLLVHRHSQSLKYVGDEVHPVCKACSKKNRPCQWESPQNKFKVYQPEGSSSKRATSEADPGSDTMDIEGGEKHDVVDQRKGGIESLTDTTSHNTPASPTSGSDRRFSYQGPSRPSSSSSHSAALQSRPPIPQGTRPYSQTPVPLTHDEAVLVHHYTEHLGRWLDCTDATRQFTLGVPLKVKLCPVLCHAVLSFAARHRKEEEAAEAAYQRCIALLIDRLNEDAASHDETLLCAIVILRFYEQLSVPSNTGSDDQNHLAGTSAILRASQGHHFVDPSAPTLREAAFWVYVRQCLYMATIDQHTPNIDFSLQLHPTPASMHDSHPLARLRLETAWSNQMTWNLAHVVNYCFDNNDMQSERSIRTQRWQALSDQVQQWANERPEAFNPIFQGKAGEKGSFPEIWFTRKIAISFGFYHFACLMLLTYKPGPKFAIHNVASLSELNHTILEHARVICGACKCSPATVPLSITVCHSIFIWGPLVSELVERNDIVQLLVDFERNHLWPTTWIINALRQEWGMG
ncbi:hypothetical protein DE146DRAFT_765693 [Phaeosphaeria sp. MPI-PUGE-AT-0046c]|nr:hypothetical protein DE146DRAFT_765693 [Phaeosphaeria sp. MPI-PUGE-AT-0046c]